MKKLRFNSTFAFIRMQIQMKLAPVPIYFWYGTILIGKSTAIIHDLTFLLFDYVTKRFHCI